MTRRAIFLDRDGTIIEDPGYLSDPEQIKLLPGAELAIKSLRQAGYAIVIITNQSGVARGMLTEEKLATIHKTLKAKLADTRPPELKSPDQEECQPDATVRNLVEARATRSTSWPSHSSSQDWYHIRHRPPSSTTQR